MNRLAVKGTILLSSRGGDQLIPSREEGCPYRAFLTVIPRDSARGVVRARTW